MTNYIIYLSIDIKQKSTQKTVLFFYFLFRRRLAAENQWFKLIYSFAQYYQPLCHLVDEINKCHFCITKFC